MSGNERVSAGDASKEGARDGAAVRARVFEAHDRLRALLPGLDEHAVREPSALPGWSRAHVLSHIEGVCLALARQAEYALSGELTEVYDGGRAGRDAGIEAGALRDAAALARAVTGALEVAEAAWAAVGPGDWARPVRYRDGRVLTALLAWWREAVIHTSDTLLGPGPEAWPRDFCRHALEFLAPRTPPGVRLVLRAEDGGEVWERGSGRTVTVRGPLTGLTAWMAGRPVPAPLRPAEPSLPRLAPWP